MDWLPFADWHPHIFAQLTATPPNTNASASGDASIQIEILKQQLEFLAKENARLSAEFTEKLKLMADEQKQLNDSFKTSVETIKSVIYFVGIFASGAIGFLAFLFGKTFKEAKAIAQNTVTRQVENRMAAIADARIDIVQRSFQRESVIEQAQVDYWLLDGTDLPREATLLEDRGFSIRFLTTPRRRGQSPEVVVLDLNNWKDSSGTAFADLTKDEQEAQRRQQIDLIPPDVRAIVVYAVGYSAYLNEVGKTRLVAPTNNTVTLVGMVVDAAYLVHGGGQQTNPVP